MPKRANEEYRAWIRGHPCVACKPGERCGKIEAAHVKGKGAGGRDEGNLVPLGWGHHRGRKESFHQLGRWTFARRFRVNLPKIAKELWPRYCREKGLDPEKAKPPRTVRNTKIKGRTFEWKIRDDLRANGWWAQRIAASRSVCDVLGAKRGRLAFIQAKANGRITTNERSRLLTDAHQAGAEPVIARPGENGIRYTLATGGEEWKP